jgi:DNA polymerase-3 subunit gamma/tau
MSYLVLARKWRPQTFEEVIGQSHVTKTLQNALRNNCVAHALLFSGPRGTGKTSVARIIAKALNCKSGPSPHPCNKCGICREITAGSSIDVQEIDGASNRGIDEIRQLRENIQFLPTRCSYRIYIIDEVHMLTKEAFNALLKTLEEPPPHVYFIFATTEPEKIPATINSRCQHYEFRRLCTAELADHLSRIINAEGMGLQQDAILLLAREAEGSVRDSLSLLDQVAAYGATSLKEVCEVLGIVETQVLKQLAVAILESDIAGALKLIDDVYNFGGNIQKFIADLVFFFRNLVVLKNLKWDRAVTLLDFSREDAKEFSSVISGYSAHSLFQVLDALIKGQEAICRSTTPKLSLEMLVIRLCSIKEVLGIDELLGKMDKLLSSTGIEEENFSEGPAKEMNAAPAVNPATVTPKRCSSEEWTDFINSVKEQHPVLGSLLDCCESIETKDNGDLIQLKCRSGIQHDMLCEVHHQQRLRELTKRFFKRATDVVIEEIRENNDVGAAGKTFSLRDELIQSPLVKEAVKVFHAQISDVRVFSNRGQKCDMKGVI